MALLTYFTTTRLLLAETECMGCLTTFRTSYDFRNLANLNKSFEKYPINTELIPRPQKKYYDNFAKNFLKIRC